MWHKARLIALSRLFRCLLFAKLMLQNILRGMFHIHTISAVSTHQSESSETQDLQFLQGLNFATPTIIGVRVINFVQVRTVLFSPFKIKLQSGFMLVSLKSIDF